MKLRTRIVCHRPLLYFCPLILFISLEAFSETREYLNRYQELYAGITPIHEMLDYLGAPKEITGSRDDIHYSFQNLKVTALILAGDCKNFSGGFSRCRI